MVPESVTVASPPKISSVPFPPVIVALPGPAISNSLPVPSFDRLGAAHSWLVLVTTIAVKTDWPPIGTVTDPLAPEISRCWFRR